MKSKAKIAKLKLIISKSPTNPGIYKMIAQNGEILYIGKARNLKNRLNSYVNLSQLPSRLQMMVLSIEKIEVIETSSEQEALLLEADLIKTLNPKYNIRLRDDKSYPYIFLSSNHKFPGIYKIRKNKTKLGKYFGPFTNSHNIDEMLDMLKKIFLIRSCKDSFFNNRKRPCLEYDIKRCTAPCVGYVTTKEYKEQIKQVLKFLNGNSETVKNYLIKKMNEFSEELDYENAAIFRDRIKAINTILARQHITLTDLKEFDLVAFAKIGERYVAEIFFYRNNMHYGNKAIFLENTQGESESEIYEYFFKKFYISEVIPKAILTNAKFENNEIIANWLTTRASQKVKLLFPSRGNKQKLMNIAIANAKTELAKRLAQKQNIQNIYQKIKQKFALIKIPNRIELYDNSHLSGTNQIGAMVSVTQDGFDKKNYRLFNIKSDIKAGDDYAMLEEVLTRRFTRLIKEDPKNQKGSWPDLILIDGGKGQATITKRVFCQLGIDDFPFYCIAKGKERNKGKERFCNDEKDYFSIKDKELLYYLQRMRDEVHRFVITNLRKKSNKSIYNSELENIKGIGHQKHKDLIEYFGSIDAIKNASIDELAKVKGISKLVAKDIFTFFH